MTTKRFTKKEIEVLKENPFTHRVTENIICFTIEFKELFWSYYQSGLQPMAIFARMGYDPNILGERRIGNISHRIRKTILSGKGFDTSYGPKPKPRPKNYDEMLPEVAIASRTYELKYLRQEVEFLKKLYALETRKKQGK